MHRVKARSTPTARQALVTCRSRYKSATGPGDIAITPEQIAIIDDTNPNGFLTVFLRRIGDLDTANALQARATTTLNAGQALVRMLVSHFHQVLDFGIARGVYQPGAAAYYHRDAGSTTLPDMSSLAATQTAAKDIIEGETRRQTAEGSGFVPMANPSASDVAAGLGTFNGALSGSQIAQRNTNTAQEAVQAMTPDAITNANDIGDYVEYFYRRDPDDSSRRAKCEEWGNIYVSDTPPPPAPPAPTP